jgi:hypothetical protein
MTKAKQVPGIPPTLTPAQRRVLGNVKVASHEPATLAHAHRPRVWTVTITEAGKDAIR